MTIAKGFLSLAAVKKATTWGTPVACGALNGVGFVSESIAADVSLTEDQQLEGANSTQRQGELAMKKFSGDLVTAARYEGLDLLVALVMGKSAGVPSTVDTSAKKQILKMEPTAGGLEGLFATLVIDKKIKVAEFTTCKVTGFTLECKAGERAQITFKVAAHDMNENVGGGTNNTTTFATVTLPANRDFLHFANMVCRINAQTAGALGSTDVKYLTSIKIDVDRAYAIDDVTTQFGTKIDEPIQDGWSTVTVELEFSKYNDASTGGNADQFTAQLAKTAQKMDLVFTSPTLAGAATQYFQWSLFLNGIQWESGTPNVGGPGRVGYTLSGKAHRVTSAPTGFTAGYTDPLVMELYNQTAADVLA